MKNKIKKRLIELLICSLLLLLLGNLFAIWKITEIKKSSIDINKIVVQLKSISPPIPRVDLNFKDGDSVIMIRDSENNNVIFMVFNARDGTRDGTHATVSKIRVTSAGRFG